MQEWMIDCPEDKQCTSRLLADAECTVAVLRRRKFAMSAKTELTRFSFCRRLHFLSMKFNIESQNCRAMQGLTCFNSPCFKERFAN